MKKTNMVKKNALLLVSIAAVLFFSLNAEKAKAEADVWENVGTAGFSSTSIDYISSAFNPETDELYVAYVDSPTTLSVKKFNGTSWVNVGSGFASYGVSGGPQDHISLAFNPSTNEPYVAFRDFANSNKATVKRFNGTSWVDVGTPGFSGAGAYYISLAFYYPTNEPYVAYQDSANSNKATVKRFNGTSWVDVGTPGFSDGTVEYISFAINPGTEEPYIAYSDWANSHKATVKKFDGASWVDVGMPGFSADSIAYASLAFHPTTFRPYVFFSDSTDKARVKRFDGTSWVNVGTGISTFSVNDVSIDFDFSTGEPYIAYTDLAKATVKKFNGTSWVNIGNLDTIATQASFTFLVLNPVTNEPTIAYKDGLNSNKATVMKFNSNTVATPFVSPDGGTYTSAQTVGPMCTTTGAAIYYTTDGSTPTTGSTLYSGGGIIIDTNTTLKAIAVKSGMDDSDVMSETYVIKVATPAASPTGGTYSASLNVTLLDMASGADIYYTIDGSTPTISSTPYSAAIAVSQNTTIKAIGIKAGMEDSDVMSEEYIIKATAPSMDPSGGTYMSAQNVTLSTTTSGASIYYTTNGSTPTTGSTLYSGAISISQNTTLKAIATKAGITDSEVASETYVIKNATPTASPAGATFTSAQSVTLSTETSGASIYYTIDGSVPTSGSILYSGAITVGASETIKAIALKSGMGDSDVMSESYVINIPETVSTPTASPNGGTFTSNQSVSLSTTTPGATIYYTTDGVTTPTVSSTQYTGAISITASTTLKAFAVKSGMTDSSIMTSSFTINKNNSSDDSCGKNCKTYKKYKKNFGSIIHKNRYNNIKKLKKSDTVAFEAMSAVYKQYRTAGDRFRSTLNPKTLDIFKRFRSYEGYKSYLKYKDKAGK